MPNTQPDHILTLDAAGRRELTAIPRAEFQRRIAEQVNPDGTLPPEEVAFRIKQVRRQMAAEMGRRSGEARRAKSDARKAAANEAAIAQLVDEIFEAARAS
jgi:hypothetical protein